MGASIVRRAATLDRRTILRATSNSACSPLTRSRTRNFPLPIVIAQHIAEGFVPGLASWLDAGSQIKVAAAENGKPVKAGADELAENPRARSAVMRVAEKASDEPIAGAA